MKLARTLLRAVLGALFFGHGAQKLFGWWGGHGLEGTGAFFESLGLKPGRRHALAAGAAEAGGGAALALGALSPAAASALIATMLTAIHRVHAKNGPWATDGGYEYNLVLILALLALTEAGPGPVSVDAALGSERHGTRWALASLAAGAAGAAGANLVAQAGAGDDAPGAEAAPAAQGPAPAETSSAAGSEARVAKPAVN